MSEGLKTTIFKKDCTYTIIVDSSGSIGEVTFATVKLCVIGLIEKIPNGCKIMIINFSNTAVMVSEFQKDKELLEKSVSTNLNYIGNSTNLESALVLAFDRITKFQSEIKNNVILITDGEPDKDPKSLIHEMIHKQIEFICVGVGNVSKVNLQKLLPGQRIFMFDTYLGLCDYIKKMSRGADTMPLGYIVYPADNKIQRSNSILQLTVEIFPALNTESYKPNEIELTILENNYYYGYKVIVDKAVDYNNPCTALVNLRVKNNAKNKDVPKTIGFEFNVKQVTYSGNFSLDYAWFCGDLIFNHKINILVEGHMGKGKSSILNLLYNIFTSDQTIDHLYLATRNSNHTTTKFKFGDVSEILDYKERDANFFPIYQDIIDQVKIALVDKPGMSSTLANVNCSLLAQGCYPDKTSKDAPQVKAPNPEYAIHSFIFVVALDEFAGDEKEIEPIRLKIIECITEAKIQPILVITFCDNYTAEEADSIKKLVYGLPVQKQNIFFITPYIDGDKNRDASKDLLGWKLLKRSFEIGKQTFNENRIKDVSSSSSSTSNKTSPITTPTKSNSGSNSPKNNKSFDNIDDSGDNPTTPIKYIQTPPTPTSTPTTPTCTSSTSPTPSTPNKPWVILVRQGKELNRFRVSPKISVREFTLEVAKKFTLSADQFYLEFDGCTVSESSLVQDVLEELCELNINVK